MKIFRGSILLVVLASLAACGDDDGPGAGGSGAAGGSSPGGGGAGEGGAGGNEAPICGTANGELPEGLSTLEWHDAPDTNLREQNLTLTLVTGEQFVLNDEPIHEAVRFELEHPARIHGFSIHWGGLPEDAPSTFELGAGLYEDFGRNGFDFWAPDPLWSGTRCLAHFDADGYVTYVFDEPIEMPHPELVYVAHFAQPGEPVFDFDDTGTADGTCPLFYDCESALNLPDAMPLTLFNGLSSGFPYDYAVRLHLEYTEDLEPAERIFQPADFTPYGHASFGDVDADGDDDLLTEGPRLFENQGDGSFVDVTDASGITALAISGSGGVFGDYDNDGCLDVFVYAESHTAPDSLLRNECNGTFTDRTATSGILDVFPDDDCPGENTRSPTAAAAWLDVDADGLLDLYLANFLCWETSAYYVDEVWHNLGNGAFEDWTAQNGFSDLKWASRGASPIDADRDGDIDLFVNAYHLQRNSYFQNAGGGVVQEAATALGLDGTLTQGAYGHTIGGAWGDLDGDGDFDLIAANLAHPRYFHYSDKTEVLLQQDDGTFVDNQGDWDVPRGASGLRYQETHSVPALADFDHDGALDLIITAVYESRPTDFYWGNGDGTFTIDAYHAGIDTKNGWGVALSDLDLDGDIDAFAHRPFFNEGAGLGHFIQVRAIGDVSSNRAAIGATVYVETANGTSMRHVQGGTGQGNQDSMYLHFGLADEASVEEIRVVFPGGEEVIYPGPFDADQRVWVYESGTVALGWVNPT